MQAFEKMKEFMEKQGYKEEYASDAITGGFVPISPYLSKCEGGIPGTEKTEIEDSPLHFVCGTCQRCIPSEDLQGQDHDPWEILQCRACQNAPCHLPIGEQVTYKQPVDITSAQNYSWIQKVGTVTGYDSIYELVQIQPDDQNEDVVQVSTVYVKVTQPIENYEKEKGESA